MVINTSDYIGKPNSLANLFKWIPGKEKIRSWEIVLIGSLSCCRHELLNIIVTSDIIVLVISTNGYRTS